MVQIVCPGKDVTAKAEPKTEIIEKGNARTNEANPDRQQRK